MILKKRQYLTWLLWLPFCVPCLSNAEHPESTGVLLASPSGTVQGEVFMQGSQLYYQVDFNRHRVIQPSPLGITVEGQSLGRHASIESVEIKQVHHQYPVLGVHSVAHNHYREAMMTLQSPSQAHWYLQLRAYNDGFAYRYVIPQSDASTVTVNGEQSSWTLPENSDVWYFERDSDWKLKTYAGEWLKTTVNELPAVSANGPVQGPPLVVELPEHQGYAVLTEAALYNYSGMRLRALGQRRVQADFTEGERGFSVDTADGAMDGATVTPWRVTMLGENLDALVNSDLITNLNPAPDESLFAETDYIKPGRAVWRWWSRETGTPAQERQFVDYASELGFEYSLVDDGWESWESPWASLEQLTGYANGQNVDVFVWKDWNQVKDPSGDWGALRVFLDGVCKAGAVGVKLDFMNAESIDRIRFEEAALRLAAERKLMVVFHGIQKPTGESRTYPNEISREGIRGLELNRMDQPLPASHNAALPFTRFLVGHGDYTPLGYSLPGNTTYAHQLATVVLFTSPFQVIAEHPDMLLHNDDVAAGLELLKTIPAVWDETRVLPSSRIGELALIARRSGDHWYLAALNGTDQPVRIDSLDLSFLGEGTYTAEVVFSPEPRRLQKSHASALDSHSEYSLKLLPRDGAVLRFSPTP
jgi:alpha-glucosidase